MKINLSEYHESILNDEMITVVLAWIENSGRITEFELIKEIGIDEGVLKNIVIKLYRNNLIDISNDFLSITENGKIIVDALQLSDNIIENSYFDLLFKPKEKKFINKSVHWYHDNHYNAYLNTFTSLKYWNRFRSDDKHNQDEPQVKSINYLLILFHDIIHIYLQSEKKALSFESLISYIGSKTHVNSSDDLKYSQEAFSLFIDYVNIKTKDDLNRYDKSRKEMFIFLKCKNYFLNDFQTQKTINKSLHSESAEHGDDARRLFWNYTSNWLEIDHFLPHHESMVKKLPFYSQKTKASNSTILDELVFIIENSSSLADISLSTHKSITDTRELLVRLKKGIKRLTKD